MPEEIDTSNMSAEEIAELQKQNCIFCKIAEKQIPAKIIHEDSDIICVLDINPASEGHILVYPKKHYMILPHIPDDVLGKLFKGVQLMSNTLLKTVQCKGTTVFIANGAAAGQRAPHVLIHVFPRREGDGLVELPKYEMNEEQMLKLRASLKPYLAQVFGAPKKTNEKVAEFHDVKEEKQGIHVTPDIAPEEEAEEKEEEPEQEETLESAEEPAPQEVKKKTARKKTAESPSQKTILKEEPRRPAQQVNLDDIGKLFGA